VWPDGFIGADQTSRRNARWLLIVLSALVLLALLPSCATQTDWAGIAKTVGKANP
jgi:hypothetical protein